MKGSCTRWISNYIHTIGTNNIIAALGPLREAKRQPRERKSSPYMVTQGWKAEAWEGRIWAVGSHQSQPLHFGRGPILCLWNPCMCTIDAESLSPLPIHLVRTTKLFNLPCLIRTFWETPTNKQEICRPWWLAFPKMCKQGCRISPPLHFILGEFTPSYMLHTRAFGTYLLGGIYLAEKIIRWWYFTCKHVSLF